MVFEVTREDQAETPGGTIGQSKYFGPLLEESPQAAAGEFERPARLVGDGDLIEACAVHDLAAVVVELLDLLLKILPLRPAACDQPGHRG